MKSIQQENYMLMPVRIKICAFFVCLMLTQFLFATENLLKNPGYEEGLKYWSYGEWSGKAHKINIIADQTTARSGESSARLEWIEGGDNLVLGQKVNIRSAKNFLFTFYAKSRVVVSGDSTVQATARFLKNNDRDAVDSVHKIFTVSDSFNEFSWSFTAPPEASSMVIYLRCRQIASWFDDVTLIESNGLYIKEALVWLPGEEIILDLYHDDTATTDRVSMELSDADGKKLFAETRKIKAGHSVAESFPVPGIRPGTFTLRVYPEGDPNRAVESSIVWPKLARAWPQPYAELQVRNNFVTELLIAEQCNLAADEVLEFKNPRRGWVLFRAKANRPVTLRLIAEDKSEAQPFNLPSGQENEVMRFLPAGKLRLQSGCAVQLNGLSITTMGEAIASEYESDADRRAFTNGLMESPGMLEFLKNANVIMERYANHNVLDPDCIPDSEKARLQAWRESGKKVITNIARSGLTSRWKVLPPDTQRFWMSRVGLRELDGVSIDEFGSENEEEAVVFAPAVRAINDAMPGKTLYAYCCAAWYSHRRTQDLRDALQEGGHVFAPELYMREQRSEAEAKRYISTFFDWLRHWERSKPGSIGSIVWTYGCSDSYYASYVLDTFAAADHKVFLDLQFCLAANDPELFGMRGVCPWIIRYAKPDFLLWQDRLIRHYLIEGNRDLLSSRCHRRYNPEHLINADCAEGLSGWQVQEAEAGSITAEKIVNYGFNRGTRNTAPAGDDVIVMKRIPGKVNSISQTIRNLKPGRRYELNVRSADYDNVCDTASAADLKLMPLRVMVSGAEVIPEQSIIHVYPVVQKTPDRKKGICGNHCNVVFRATDAIAKVTISDEIPIISARTYHGQDFAEADPAQKKVLFNFVQVTELFDGNE